MRKNSAPPLIGQTTRTWVLDSIAGSFAGMYLTLLSIIQGVALAAWATDAIPGTAVGWRELLSVRGIDEIGFRITTLLAIVVIWHAYFWLSVIARWVPSIWDSVLMFTIGAAEFVPILNMGDEAWFFGMGSLGVLGGFAYVFNARELDGQSYEPDLEELWNHVRTYKEERGFKLIGLGLTYLLAAAAVTAAGRVWDLVLLSLALVPQIGVLRYSESRRRRIPPEQRRKLQGSDGSASQDSFMLLILALALGVAAYLHIDQKAWVPEWLLFIAFAAQYWVVLQHMRTRKRTLAILAWPIAPRQAQRSDQSS